MKKKNSLKDILKNKKTIGISTYKGMSDSSKGLVIKKSHK